MHKSVQNSPPVVYWPLYIEDFPSNVAHVADIREDGMLKNLLTFLNSTGDVFPHTWGINSVGEYLFAG